MIRWWQRREAAFLYMSSGLLLVGGLAFLADAGDVAAVLWSAATIVGLVWSTASLMLAVREHRHSVDVVAWLALAGSLIVGEAFAGAMIAMMLATGVVLEARASARARRELSQLVSRTPRFARRHTAGGLCDVPIDDVAVGDRLLVRSGEVVPVDGRLLGPAVLDESALTGEARPVDRPPGDDVRSGVVNAGSPLDLVATATAARSTYAGVVRLVEQAQASTAPFVRAADRFAVAFVPLTLLVAGVAWLATGDAVRAVAVLVVATPCPLLLAAPIAIVSGLSRAARTGVIVKGGSALERLAAGRILLFDKTGTLTRGRPTLSEVVCEDGFGADRLLSLAASLDQASAHVLAGAIVRSARSRGLPLTTPEEVRERHGYGVEGVVDGRRVRLGRASWIVRDAPPAWLRQAQRRAALEGSPAVYASIDDAPAGVFLFDDPIRPDAPRMIRALRSAGIERVVLVTGDRADMASTVARIVGVDAVHPERDPAEKLAIVREEQSAGPTIMVGDGINDAPALAAAGVGVALAGQGTSASAEAADIVLTVDRLGALADAILIARRSRRIAWRSVLVGMGLSLVAMAVAAAGQLPPAGGALLQELIDVAAIAIALTALWPTRLHTVAMSPVDAATARRLFAEHRAISPVVEQIRTVADGLADGHSDARPARDLLKRLERELLPHERAEEAELLPIVARALGGSDPTGPLSRTHAEIEHQTARLRRLLADVQVPVDATDIVELRRLLYGLYAIMRLHNAQEEEGAFCLVPDEPALSDR